MKLTILRGVPASGKSTYAKQFLIDNPDTVRVNMDSLRLMFRNETYDRKFEKLVKKSEIQVLEQCIRLGFDVIVDDTNLTLKRIDSLINFVNVISCGNAEIEVITMNTHKDDCYNRNEHRKNRVPVNCMTDMFELFEKHYLSVDLLLKARGIKHTNINNNLMSEELIDELREEADSISELLECEQL